jgi:GAF domain-containing protein
VLGEGPCYDSSWPGQTLTVSDLAEDERWPTWAAEAGALGVASLLASALTTREGRRIGCIIAYWTHHRCFTPDDIAFMAIFARHAALALTKSWTEAGLNTALDTRKLIGQAQGLLMERYDLDEARAFEVPRRYSQHHNIKLRDVAAHLIETRQLPTPATLHLPTMDKTA